MSIIIAKDIYNTIERTNITAIIGSLPAGKTDFSPEYIFMTPPRFHQMNPTFGYKTHKPYVKTALSLIGSLKAPYKADKLIKLIINCLPPTCM